MPTIAWCPSEGSPVRTGLELPRARSRGTHRIICFETDITPEILDKHHQAFDRSDCQAKYIGIAAARESNRSILVDCSCGCWSILKDGIQIGGGSLFVNEWRVDIRKPVTGTGSRPEERALIVPGYLRRSSMVISSSVVIVPMATLSFEWTIPLWYCFTSVNEHGRHIGRNVPQRKPNPCLTRGFM